MSTEDWKKYKLSEIAIFKNGKERPSDAGNIPVYGGNGIFDHTDSFNSEGEVIIIGRVGAYCGSVYYENKPVWISDNAMAAQPKENYRTKFIYYLLKMLDLNRYAEGSSHPLLTQSILNQIEILFTSDISQQDSIASILSSLDDKIELNLRMNKTLESIAQAIFKEWFVDFSFPGFDGELVDGLPKGWRIGTIGDIANVIDCLHSKKPERVQTNTGCILLQLNNILDNGLLDPTDKFYISKQEYSNWISRIEITEGDCVITNVGRVGSVARIPEDIKAALGRNMTGIRLNKNYPFPTFLIQLLVSDYMKIEIEKKKDFGTILDALNVKNIPKLSFPLPKTELISHFERIVSPMRSRMENNIKENHTLSSIRDALLPKFMTGKIRVA